MIVSKLQEALDVARCAGDAPIVALLEEAIARAEHGDIDYIYSEENGFPNPHKPEHEG